VPVQPLNTFQLHAIQQILEVLSMQVTEPNEPVARIGQALRNIREQGLINGLPELVEALKAAAKDNFSSMLFLHRNAAFVDAFEWANWVVAGTLTEHLQNYAPLSAQIMQRKATEMEVQVWDELPALVQQALRWDDHANGSYRLFTLTALDGQVRLQAYADFLRYMKSIVLHCASDEEILFFKRLPEEHNQVLMRRLYHEDHRPIVLAWFGLLILLEVSVLLLPDEQASM
jgi:hypothetical protein